MKENTKSVYGTQSDTITAGENDGFFKIKDNKIEYLAVEKKYKFTDPEEHVRAVF